MSASEAAAHGERAFFAGEAAACTGCGRAVAASDGYCRSCGTPLGTRLCTGGHVMDPGWTACAYCAAPPAPALTAGDEDGAGDPEADPRDEPDQVAEAASAPGSPPEGEPSSVFSASPAGAGFGSRATLLTGIDDLLADSDVARRPVERGPLRPARHRTVYDPGPSVSTGGAPSARRAADGARLMGWLVSLTLDPRGAHFPLYEGRNRIGSDPSGDLVLDDPTVSRRHALVMCRGGQLLISDQSSTNGTHVNGEDVLGRGGVSIGNGDRVRLGRVELTVHLL